MNEERVELAKAMFSAILNQTGAMAQIHAVEQILGLRISFALSPAEPESQIITPSESGIILPGQSTDSPGSLLS